MRVLAAFLFALALLALGWFLFKSQPCQVAVFDKQTIQAQLIRQLAQIKADDVAVQQISVRFKKLLDESLQDYSQKNHVVILDKSLLLAGGCDVTGQISEDVAIRMEKKP